MSSIPVNTSSTRPTVRLGSILRAGAIGTVLAIVGNVILFFIASAIGWMPQDVITPMGQPIGLQAVLSISVAAGVGATIVYALLTRFTKNPVRWFYIAAGLVFLLMFFNPFTLPGVGAGQIIALEVMHIVTAAALVWALTTQARPS
jgi:hypothetical protein